MLSISGFLFSNIFIYFVMMTPNCNHIILIPFNYLIHICNNAALNSVIPVTDTSVCDADKVIGDDVSQVCSTLLSNGKAENLQVAETEHSTRLPSHSHQIKNKRVDQSTTKEETNQFL